jgi:hypothetical protein
LLVPGLAARYGFLGLERILLGEAAIGVPDTDPGAELIRVLQVHCQERRGSIWAQLVAVSDVAQMLVAKLAGYLVLVRDNRVAARNGRDARRRGGSESEWAWDLGLAWASA